MTRLVDVMVMLSEDTTGMPSFLHEIETGFGDVTEQLNCAGLPGDTTISCGTCKNAETNERR